MKWIQTLCLGLATYLMVACNPIKIEEFEVQAEDFSTSGFTIPGRLFIANEKKSTTMYFCHGGPHAATDVGLLKELAERLDVNVVSLDFSGSKIKGYSNVAGQYRDPKRARAYLERGDVDYGGIHISDLKRVLEHTQKAYAHLIDAEKLIIAGHSFGGYLTALVATDPEISSQFKLAIAISGFYDLGTYAFTNVHTTKDNDTIKRRRAPKDYTGNITQTILVVHGDANGDKTTLVNRADTQSFIDNALNRKKDIHYKFISGMAHGNTAEAPETWEFAKPFIETLKAQ